jgi:hypothetical protein
MRSYVVVYKKLYIYYVQNIFLISFMPSLPRNPLKTKNNILGFVRKRTIPTYPPPLPAKLVPTFATVVNLEDVDRSRYFFFQVAPQLSSRGSMDSIPDQLLLRESGTACNRTRDLWVYSQDLWLLDHRGGSSNCNSNWNIQEIEQVGIAVSLELVLQVLGSNLGWEIGWRMASSGILPRVALVRSDVSEELSASFIRVTRIGELGTTLAVTSNRHSCHPDEGGAKFRKSDLQEQHGVASQKTAFFIVTDVKISNLTLQL